ncbi:hypothetical protein DFQ27_001695 [Actinomortierella ambigua]|uniref:Major facilitator superfamily (MFS) profile domain-containing protein n=1 Tax=Actinomortierella ambigua TaxID=1343610 RepID=A0A9P6QE37_9FUNG|nr:hypothetical protein DFQ27_001695 [Actinomortierella ambigua]
MPLEDPLHGVPTAEVSDNLDDAPQSSYLSQERARPSPGESICSASITSQFCSSPTCNIHPYWAPAPDGSCEPYSEQPWVQHCSCCCYSDGGGESVDQDDNNNDDDDDNDGPAGILEQQAIDYYNHSSSNQKPASFPYTQYLTVPDHAHAAAMRWRDRVAPSDCSTPRLSSLTSNRTTTLTTATTTSSTDNGDLFLSPVLSTASDSSWEETEHRRSGQKRRWYHSPNRDGRGGGKEIATSTNHESGSSGHRGRHRRPSHRRKPPQRRGTDERGGVQGIQHALRIGFLSTLGPGIPVTPTASVFGEQLADGMFNKSNPGGLFGYSPEEERRLVRKIDWRLIPILGIFYSLSTLNRINLTNARIFAFESALHATNEQYTWAITIFFCGFGLAEIPSIFALLYFTPKVWLPMSMFAWAMVTAALGWMRSYPGVMVLRFLLGMSEAALIPGVLIYISMFYKRSEQTFRLAILALFNSAAGAFGGLIAGATGLMHGMAGLDGWQWVFILEAIPTAICAIAAYFILARSPETAPWLNQRETSIATYRMRNDTKIKVSRTFSKKTVLSAVKDPKVYIFMIINLILTSLETFASPPEKRQAPQAPSSRTQPTSTTAAHHPARATPPQSKTSFASISATTTPPGAIATTTTTTTTTTTGTATDMTLPLPPPPSSSSPPYGTNTDDAATALPPPEPNDPTESGVDFAFQETTVGARILAQLMSSPPFVVGGLVTFAVALIVDRTQQRAYMMLGLALVTISGYSCELATPNAYASFIIYAGQSAMGPVATSWLTTNVGGYAKRAIAVAMFQLAASLAGILGSQIYQANDAPRYRVGHGVNISMLVALMACTILQRWRLRRENHRRDYSVAFGLNPIRGLNKVEIRDLGDQHPAYRYTV